jgi:DNA-directed RNA polymerase specialized sigma24 family protein
MSPADLAPELERLHPAAFGWALSCCRWDRAAAEDVLQASYLKLLDGRARFDGRSSLKTLGVEREVKRLHIALLIQIKNTLSTEQQAKLAAARGTPR